MSKKLFLLSVLASGFLAAAQPELPAGSVIEADDDPADKLLDNGTARLAAADEQVTYTVAEAAAPTGKSTKPTRVRLLLDSEHGKANDVVDLPPGQAKQLVNAAEADADKAAIAYALTLPQNARVKA